jgi:hypothetical protein
VLVPGQYICTMNVESGPVPSFGASCSSMQECAFCLQQKELFFYRCCSSCYVSSADVRRIVDGAHPVTWPSAVASEVE